MSEIKKAFERDQSKTNLIKLQEQLRKKLRRRLKKQKQDTFVDDVPVFKVGEKNPEEDEL